MNTGGSIDLQAEIQQSWRVSWVAYVPYALIIVGLISTVVAFKGLVSLMIALPVCTVVLLFVAYKLYYLSCILLYINEKGVWVYRGVFPWDRGVYGVKWLDFEDCVFHNGLIQWMTNGYPVTLRPRFSSNPQVVLPPIHQGRKAVETINTVAMTNEKIVPR